MVTFMVLEQEFCNIYIQYTDAGLVESLRSIVDPDRKGTTIIGLKVDITKYCIYFIQLLFEEVTKLQKQIRVFLKKSNTIQPLIENIMFSFIMLHFSCENITDFNTLKYTFNTLKFNTLTQSLEIN